jgi:hypothetical protein
MMMMKRGRKNRRYRKQQVQKKKNRYVALACCCSSCSSCSWLEKDTSTRNVGHNTQQLKRGVITQEKREKGSDRKKKEIAANYEKNAFLKRKSCMNG